MFLKLNTMHMHLQLETIIKCILEFLRQIKLQYCNGGKKAINKIINASVVFTATFIISLPITLRES